MASPSLPSRSPPPSLPRLQIPSLDLSGSHSQSSSQALSGPFTPQSTVHPSFPGPRTAGPFHQRFGSIQVPVGRGVGLGGLRTAAFPTSGNGGGWGGGSVPISAGPTSSSFPSSPGGHHAQMASMGGGAGGLMSSARFGRLRGNAHSRTQSIGPPPKAALGGAGIYTSAAKASASATTPSSTELVPPVVEQPAGTQKKKKIIVKLPRSSLTSSELEDEDEPLLWSRVAFSLEGDGGKVTRSKGETEEPEVVSMEVSPEEEPPGELLLLDVYLPGKRFWKVMQEERIQMRLMEMEHQSSMHSQSLYSSSSLQPPFNPSPNQHLSPYGSSHPFSSSPALLSAPTLSPSTSNPALSPISHLSSTLGVSPQYERARALPPHLFPPAQLEPQQQQQHNPYFPRLAEPQQQQQNQTFYQPNANAPPLIPRLNSSQAPFTPRTNAPPTFIAPNPHAQPFIPSSSKPNPSSSSPFRQPPSLVFGGHESVSEDTEGEEEEARMSANEEEEGERRLNNERWEEETEEDEESLEEIELVVRRGSAGGEETPGLRTARAVAEETREGREEVDGEREVEEGESDGEVRVGDMVGFGEEEEETDESGVEGGREREVTARPNERAEEEEVLELEEDELVLTRELVGGRAAWEDGSEVDELEREREMSDGEFSNPSDEDRHRARQLSLRDRSATFGAGRSRRVASNEIISNPSDEYDEEEDDFSPHHQQQQRQQQDQHQQQTSHATTNSGTGTLSPTKSSGTTSAVPYLNPLARPFQFGSYPSNPSALSPPSYDNQSQRAFDPSSIRRISNPSVFDTANSSFSRTPTYFTADEGSPRNQSSHPLPLQSSSLLARGPFNPAAAEFRPTTQHQQPSQRLHNQQRSSVESAQAFTFSSPLAVASSSPSQRGQTQRPLPPAPLQSIFAPTTKEEEERMQQGREKRVKQEGSSDGIVVVAVEESNIASRRAFHSPHASPDQPLRVLDGGDIDRLESFKMPKGTVVPVVLSPEVKFKAFKMPLAPSSPSRTKSRFLGLTLADGSGLMTRETSSVGDVDGISAAATTNSNLFPPGASSSSVPPPPLASPNSFTSSAGNGERFKRSPIPMFSSPPITSALTASRPSDAGATRASVRSRLESRDISNSFFHHGHDNSTDDSLGGMPAISQQQRNSINLLHGQRIDPLNWEEEVDSSSLGGGGGHAHRASSSHLNARSSSDALPPGELASQVVSSQVSSSLSSGPILIDDLVRRIQLLLDDKLNSLRTSDVTGGFVHLSTLHPDAEDVLVARIVGTLMEERLEAEELMHKSGGALDVEQMRSVVEEGYRAVCERVEGSVVEALRNLDLPTTSSLVSDSVDPQAVEFLRSQTSRNNQLLDEVLSRIQETSSKLDRVPPPPSQRNDASLINNLLSSLLPSIESNKIDVDSISQSVVVALAPLVEAQGSIAEERAVKPQQILELLLPHLEKLKSTPLDQEALVFKLYKSVSEVLAESVVPKLEEKMDAFLEGSKPLPPLDVKALVEAFVAALPPPPPPAPSPPPPAEPVDLSPVHSKLESILAQIVQTAELSSQRDAAARLSESTSSPSPVLQAELTELQSALRESKAISDLQTERAKVAEEERKRIGVELESSRKTALERLKEKAEEELAKVRGEHELVELRAKLKIVQEERDASLGREKMFKKENEDRAREHSKLNLKSTVTENELSQTKSQIGISQRTWAQFQQTTTNQLDALTKAMASAESKQKEELVAARAEVKKLTAETGSLEKRLNIAEEKLVSQTRASAAAAASAKQAQASLSQELGRRVKEVEGVREELSALRDRAEASDEEVAGLRSALEEREGRLISTEELERNVRSNLREAEQTIQSLQHELNRHQSSRTPTRNTPSGLPFNTSSASSWSIGGFVPQQQQYQSNGGYAPSSHSSSSGTPSSVVHHLQQQVLTPPASTFRPALPQPQPSGYFSTPTRNTSTGVGASMHAPKPQQNNSYGSSSSSNSTWSPDSRGPTATPILRVGTVKPPESDDGWWGAD